MNRPDHIHIGTGQHQTQQHQTDFPQRLTVAVVTILFAGLIFYGFPYFAYETTIKRTMYEIGTSILPTKFLGQFQRVAIDITGRLGVLPQPSLTGNRDRNSEGTGVLSVVQRARALSGFDKLSAGEQEHIYSGLGNWDNSCYQNSVLQGLASLPAFKRFVEESQVMCEKLGIEATTTEALQTFTDQLLEEMSGRRTLWPPSILKSMNTWQQQDAQEYFSKIMDAVDKESARYYQKMMKHSSPGLGSLRCDHFGKTDLPQSTRVLEHPPLEATLPRNPLDGTLSQILRCQVCAFSEGLSLMSFNCLTLNLGLGGNCFLEDLLDAYTGPELIEGVECEECARIAQEEEAQNPTLGTDAEGSANSAPVTAPNPAAKVFSTKAKQILFGRLPQDLVIHINRSIFDDWGSQRKNTSLISFPPILEIVDDWVATLGQISPRQHGTYELKCTITHSGRHDNGHYVAYGKRGKEWYGFNDEVVTKVLDEQVLDRGNVFLLFYELIPYGNPMETDTPLFSDPGETHEVENSDVDVELQSSLTPEDETSTSTDSNRAEDAHTTKL